MSEFLWEYLAAVSAGILLIGSSFIYYRLRLSLKEEKQLARFYFDSLGEDLRVANSEIINMKSMIEKLAKDNSNILLAIITIKSMVDELARHSSDISDVVDRAAKQYQDEISSLFSYCGENRSNE